MNIPGQEKEVHIYDYLRVLYKWRKQAIIFLAAIVFTVTVASFLMTPIYKGSTRILIEREAPKVLNMQDVMPISLDAVSTDFYQTQYKILQSRTVALRVVKTLNLAANPLFNTTKFPKGREPDKRTLDLILAERLLKRYKVQPIRNSRLVDLSFESPSPQFAADVTNAIAQSFIVNAMESKTNTSQEAKEFLTKQIEDQRRQLEESEQALQNYKEKYGIVQLTQVPGQKESENIAMQRLTGLTSNLIQAQTVRLETEARYREVKDLLDKGASYEAIPPISNNYLIQQLKVQEAQFEAQMSEFSQKFGEKHPKMIQLKKELDGVRQKIKTEAQQVIISLKNEYQIARAKEDSARGAMNAQKAEAQKLSEHGIQYGVLSREVEKNRELYENLLKRLKETSVVRELGTTNISIVDYAELPRVPERPKKAQYILLSFLVGVFLSVGLAFFLEYLDNTVKVPQDIETIMDIPCVALIPTINFAEELGDTSAANHELIVFHKPKSTVSEAFRSLRTAILFSFPVNSHRTLLLTSCVPREGKTFITANFALVMAYSGESVLLIDADMRKPQTHAVFGLSNEKGLSNAIVGEEPRIHKSVLHEKLDIMTSGPIPPNPAELLGSKHMTDLLESLKQKYDNIIIDSPPLTSVTDPIILSRLVDGVISIVHGGTTTRDMARRGAAQLRDINARLIGAVLNNIDIGKENYYYSHYYNYYYYHDYYGEDGTKKKKGRRGEPQNGNSSVASLLKRPIFGSKKNDRKSA
ncbi:MAG TPA: polysaccharide biosynthesis tyrosine autokinase [Syntrophorhabdaceae bacterium]|jgi:capsular exopolysaccharide synthesis family protein